MTDDRLADVMRARAERGTHHGAAALWRAAQAHARADGPPPSGRATGPFARRRFELAAAAVAVLLVGAGVLALHRDAPVTVTTPGGPGPVPTSAPAAVAGPEPSTTPPGPTSSPTTSPVSAAASPSSGPAAPTTVSPPPADVAGRCPAAVLDLRTIEQPRAMGSRHFELTFTNRGSVVCTLRGYPGVTVLDAAGAEVSQPADREPSGEVATVPVTLRPGGTAGALVRTPTSFAVPDCPSVVGVSLRVYVPGETAAVVVPLDQTNSGPLELCRGEPIGVGPVRPGDAAAPAS
jgi:hypothetical protein